MQCFHWPFTYKNTWNAIVFNNATQIGTKLRKMILPMYTIIANPNRTTHHHFQWYADNLYNTRKNVSCSQFLIKTLQAIILIFNMLLCDELDRRNCNQYCSIALPTMQQFIPTMLQFNPTMQHYVDHQYPYLLSTLSYIVS